MGICFPSLEDFSFFLGVGVVEHGLSASLLGATEDKQRSNESAIYVQTMMAIRVNLAYTNIVK